MADKTFISISYPNPGAVQQAALDWQLAPDAIAQYIAGYLVEYAYPITPRDTGALSMPSLRHTGKGKVEIGYDATNPRGQYYVLPVNEGVAWNGYPVKHYTTPGTGPHFLDKMMSKAVLEAAVKEATQGLDSLVGGAIFDATRKINSSGKYTAYNYHRPEMFSAKKYDKYFNTK